MGGEINIAFILSLGYHISLKYIITSQYYLNYPVSFALRITGNAVCFEGSKY
jgi:hypothetical protein